MTRPLVWLAIASLLLFSGAIGILHAQPYNDEAMQTLLSTSADCTLPCFLGIRLGVTTPGEAAQLLRSHAWISHITAVNELTSAPVQAIYFEWSGQQPAIFRSGSQVEMLLSAGYAQVVESITLKTTIPVGAALLNLGATPYLDSGEGLAGAEAAFISAAYLNEGILIWSLVTCPVTRAQFWNSLMVIEFSSTIKPSRRFSGLHGFC